MSAARQNKQPLLENDNDLIGDEPGKIKLTFASLSIREVQTYIDKIKPRIKNLFKNYNNSRTDRVERFLINGYSKLTHSPTGISATNKRPTRTYFKDIDTLLEFIGDITYFSNNIKEFSKFKIFKQLFDKISKASKSIVPESFAIILRTDKFVKKSFKNNVRGNLTVLKNENMRNKTIRYNYIQIIDKIQKYISENPKTLYLNELNKALDLTYETLDIYYKPHLSNLKGDLKNFDVNNTIKKRLLKIDPLTLKDKLRELENSYRRDRLKNEKVFLNKISQSSNDERNSILNIGNYSRSEIKDVLSRIEIAKRKALEWHVERKLSDIKLQRSDKERQKKISELRQFMDTVKLKTGVNRLPALENINKKIYTNLDAISKSLNDDILKRRYNVIKKRINKLLPVNIKSLQKNFENRPDLYENLKTNIELSKKGEGKKELNIANKIVKNEINYFKKYGKFKNNAQYIKQYNISPEYLKKVKNENMQNLNSNIQEIKVKYVKGLVNAREKYLEDVVKEYLSYLRNPRKEGGIKLKNIDKNYKNAVSEINKGYGSGFIKKFKPIVSKYLREEEERTRRKIRILKSRIRSRLLRERSKRRRIKPKSPQKK